MQHDRLPVSSRQVQRGPPGAALHRCRPLRLPRRQAFRFCGLCGLHSVGHVSFPGSWVQTISACVRARVREHEDVSCIELAPHIREVRMDEKRRSQHKRCKLNKDAVDGQSTLLSSNPPARWPVLSHSPSFEARTLCMNWRCRCRCHCHWTMECWEGSTLFQKLGSTRRDWLPPQNHPAPTTVPVC